MSALRLAEADNVLQTMRSGIEAVALEYRRMLGGTGPEAFRSFGFAIRINNLKLSSSQLVVDIVGRAMLICGIAGYRNDSKLQPGPPPARRVWRGADGQQRPHHDSQRDDAARAQRGVAVRVHQDARRRPSDAIAPRLLDAGLLIAVRRARRVRAQRRVRGRHRALRPVRHARRARSSSPEVMRFPPLLSRAHYERMDHIETFPEPDGLGAHVHGRRTRTISSCCARGRRARTGARDSAADRGDDDAGGLLSALSDGHGHAARRRAARSTCARSCSVTSRRSTRRACRSSGMHEYVRLGTPEQALEHRDYWLERGQEMLARGGPRRAAGRRERSVLRPRRSRAWRRRSANRP